MDNIFRAHKIYKVSQDEPSRGPPHHPDHRDFGLPPSTTHDYDHSFHTVNHALAPAPMDTTLAVASNPYSVRSILMASSGARSCIDFDSALYEEELILPDICTLFEGKF